MFNLDLGTRAPSVDKPKIATAPSCSILHTESTKTYS